MSWNVSREEWLASLRGDDPVAEGSEEPVDMLDQEVVDRMRDGGPRSAGDGASPASTGSTNPTGEGPTNQVVSLGTAAPITADDDASSSADSSVDAWRPSPRNRALTPPADIGSQVARGAFRPPRRSAEANSSGRSVRTRREAATFVSPFASVAEAQAGSAELRPPANVVESGDADVVADAVATADLVAEPAAIAVPNPAVEPEADDRTLSDDDDPSTGDMGPGRRERFPTLELEAVVEPGPPPLAAKPPRRKTSTPHDDASGSAAEPPSAVDASAPNPSSEDVAVEADPPNHPPTPDSVEVEPPLLTGEADGQASSSVDDPPPALLDSFTPLSPADPMAADDGISAAVADGESNGLGEISPDDDPGTAGPVRLTDASDLGAAEDDHDELEAADVEPAELHHDELEEVEDIVEDGTPAPAEVRPPPAPAPAPEVRSPPTPPPPTPKPTKRRRAWYEDVFGEHYAALSPRAAATSAVRDVDFMLACCPLDPGARVLDVGCGAGLHALSFAQRGMSVTGIDNSMAQLFHASRNNEASGSPVTFQHGDMRQIDLEGAFDLVTCVGTTFGYFEDEQNLACLEQMRDRLKPEGRLVLHVFNRDFVVGHMPCRSWWQGEGCLVLDECEVNFVANRLRVHRTIVFEDARQFEHYMFIRAYTLHDIGRMLSRVGMRVIEVSGSRDARGRFYGAASPDIWIVAARQS